MSNRSPKNFVAYRLLIDVIDYSSMTHRLVIDYYTAQERHFYCFLVPFFSFVIFLAALDEVFPCISEKFLSTMSRHKVLITNTDDSQLCNISLYPTLY